MSGWRPGKAKAEAMRRCHQGVSAISQTGPPSQACSDGAQRGAVPLELAEFQKLYGTEDQCHDHLVRAALAQRFRLPEVRADQAQLRRP